MNPTHTDVDIARAASTIEAWERTRGVDAALLRKSAIIILDAYRALQAERLPEPEPVQTDGSVVRGIWVASVLASLFWAGLWWAVTP